MRRSRQSAPPFAAAKGDFPTVSARAGPSARTRKFRPTCAWRDYDGATAAAAIQGKLQRADEDARDRAALATATDRPGAYYNAFTDIAALDAVYRGDPARGKRLLDSILAARPLAQVPPDQRPYLDLAWTYVLLGDAGRARALLAEGARSVDSAQWRARGELPPDSSWACSPCRRTGQPTRSVSTAPP